VLVLRNIGPAAAGSRRWVGRIVSRCSRTSRSRPAHRWSWTPGHPWSRRRPRRPRRSPGSRYGGIAQRVFAHVGRLRSHGLLLGIIRKGMW